MPPAKEVHDRQGPNVAAEPNHASLNFKIRPYVFGAEDAAKSKEGQIVQWCPIETEYFDLDVFAHQYTGSLGHHLTIH